MLHVSCFMFHASCFMFRVSCFVFHVHVSCSCFMFVFHVRVSCSCFMFMFHVCVSCSCFMFVFHVCVHVHFHFIIFHFISFIFWCFLFLLRFLVVLMFLKVLNHRTGPSCCKWAPRTQPLFVVLGSDYLRPSSISLSRLIDWQSLLHNLQWFLDLRFTKLWFSE